MAKKDKNPENSEFKMGVGAGKSSSERTAAQRAANARASQRNSSRNNQNKKKRTSPARHQAALLGLLAAIIVYCVFMFFPPTQTITQGLDIRGGLSVIMSASHPDGSAVTDEQMDEAVAIVTNRVNSLGASEATVQREGDNSILVQIPGVEDSDTALSTIGRTGTLEFVDLNDISDAQVVQNIMAGYTGFSLDPGSYTAFMTGDSLTNVTVGQASKGGADYAVNLTLNGEGTQAFADVTTQLVATHAPIAILLDGVVQSAPRVQSAITNGQVAITGNYTLDEAKSLQTILESGALPVTLSFSEARTVGPTLGQESLQQAILAAGAGMLVVIIYLLFFYGGFGLLTGANLIVFALIYLGVLATLSRLGAFALTLPGLAGIVLTIGMAADSSILVRERFREEIRMGRSIKSASISGVKHGIGTSLDGDVVSLISGIVLFIFAVGTVKGFGLTLALGIICDIITMFLFKAPTIRLLAPGVITKNPGFWGLKADIAEAVANGAGQYTEESILPKAKKAAEPATQDDAEKGGAENA